MGRSLQEAVAGTVVDKEKSSPFPRGELTTIIAQRYDAPPENAEELLARIQGLIPNPDTNPSQEETLFSILIKTGAFKGETTTCPAIRLTKLMLDEWGRQLDSNEEYRQKFLATIQKPKKKFWRSLLLQLPHKFSNK